ncbi:hypothetical protein N9Y31_05650 [Alphaproteobacteria bacterium]|nr:hypothetical protein [Alphaproteobacteria bacterium]
MREMMVMPWPARYIELLIEVKAKLPDITVLSAGDMAPNDAVCARKHPKIPGRLTGQSPARICVGDVRPSGTENDTPWLNDKAIHISFK